MSLISRIRRLIESNLRQGDPDGPGMTGSFYDDYIFRREQRAERARQFNGESAEREPSQQAGFSREGQDPQLAAYYANLEIPYGSDLNTVREAWKRLMRTYHPDRHSGDPGRQRTANELVQKLNHAYSELRKHLDIAG